MIIVTGTQGFIGRHFLNTLKDKDEEVIEIDQQGAWYFKSQFNKWEEVDLIIHQGAITDTTCTGTSCTAQYSQLEYSCIQ